MKWVADETGRFKYRPEYDRSELDGEFELLLSAFMVAKYGGVHFPISTDDLTVMIEKDASDLDLYADLSALGEDVEGVTEFYLARKPAVRIARELSLGDEGRHRLRTTLAHEYGHVKLHRFLWSAKFETRPNNVWPRLERERVKYARLRARLGDESADSGPHLVARAMAKAVDRADPRRKGPVCGVATMLDAPLTDWMEWQASYAAGAILMPATALRGLVSKSAVGCDSCVPVSSLSETSRMVSSIAATFDVSEDAARVRLTRLGIFQ
jgi:hypothetical protein